jgi:hypothetical protein
MAGKPFLVAFKATTMQTRSSIIEWLRARDAVHVLADLWLLSLPSANAGDIAQDSRRRQTLGYAKTSRPRTAGEIRKKKFRTNGHWDPHQSCESRNQLGALGFPA